MGSNTIPLSDAPVSHAPLSPLLRLGNVGAVQLSVLPECIKIILRGDGLDTAFSGAVGKVTGLSLPLEANTVAANNDATLLWLGPDEWQWRQSNKAGQNLDIGAAAASLADTQRRLADLHAAAIDVTDYYVLLCLQGCQAYQVLEKGTPLDARRALHPTRCAQTRFGNAAILLNQIEADVPTFHVQVRWSYAEYLWQYLSEAMREFI